MRIAQVSPLNESIPPRTHGDTERVISFLTDELVRQGHDVTLFAAGDTRTRATLVPICRRAHGLAYHTLLLDRVACHAAEFDIIHFHTDFLHFPLSRRLALPQITTLHGRLDLPELQSVYNEFTDMPLVSTSDDQRRPLPQANFCRTIHHGLPSDLCALHREPGDYLAFIGPNSPGGRIDRAIEIARSLDMPIKIAATIDPLSTDPRVEWVGELDEQAELELLGRARCLLHLDERPEPPGLVMIEAMACGTPVIALRHGSAPEVIDHGLTGALVDSVEEAAAAVDGVLALDRRRIRETFERRFTAEHMARDYLRVYARYARPRAVSDAGRVPDVVLAGRVTEFFADRVALSAGRGALGG